MALYIPRSIFHLARLLYVRPETFGLTLVYIYIYIYIHIYIYTHTHTHTRLFISPSGIFDPCGTVAGMVTPKGSMSTEGKTLQVSVLPYRCSICAPLVTRQMSILFQSSSCDTRCRHGIKEHINR
jgi:hypothetical protein